MPARLGLLRGFLGLLCIFFAHFCGRALARRLLLKDHKAPVLSWTLRTVVSALAVLWPGRVDGLALAVFSLAVVAGLLGYHAAAHPRKPEDLSRAIFPGD